MKRLALLLALLLVLLSFASCKPQNNPVPPSNSELSSSEVSSKEESSSEVSSDKSSSVSSSDKKDETPKPDHSVHTSHYCYSNLTSLQKSYYDKMYEAVWNMASGWITLGDANVHFGTDIAVAREAMLNDHPHIFWVSSYYATAVSQDGKSAMVMFQKDETGEQSYLILRSEKDALLSQLDSAVKELTSLVTLSDPFSIELQLHDLLCSRVTYTASSDPMVYTAFGALVNRSAVCEGYSRAMQLLLSKFNINSVLVSGFAGGESHMWNAVSLGGRWYHLDATWNDRAGGTVSHEYFNLTTSLISLDHSVYNNFNSFALGTLDNGNVPFNIKTPYADGTENYYFNKNGFIYYENGDKALADYITANSSDYFEIAFGTTAFRDFFIENADSLLADFNLMLSTDYPDYDRKVDGYSVSRTALRLYMKEKQPALSEETE